VVKELAEWPFFSGWDGDKKLENGSLQGMTYSTMQL